MVFLHLSVLLFGLAGLFGKFLAIPALTIVGGRTLFASLALLTVCGLFYRKSTSFRFPGGRQLLQLAASGALLALHWWAFFYSIRISTVAVGLISYSTFPIFVTFIEPLFFRERLKLRNVLFAGVVFAGLLLVVPAFDFRNNITQGVLWGLVAGLSFGVLALMNRHMTRTVPPLQVSLFQNTAAFLCCAPFAIKTACTLTPADWFLLVLLGVVCTALSHTLFIAALSKVKALTAAIVASLEPVYGIVFALLLLHEIPGVRVMAGGAIILAATIFVTVRHGKLQNID